MDTFQKVLKRARDEGQIDPRLLSVDGAKTSDKKGVGSFYASLQLPPQLLALPPAVIQDLQKITENIRQSAETQKLQIIGFAGAVPGQGTATLTSLISLLMATREQGDFAQVEEEEILSDRGKTKQKIGLLLIDAQFQHPSLHHKFKCDQKGGLTEVFKNEIPVSKTIKPIEHTSLKLITSGLNKNFQLSQNDLNRLALILAIAKKHVAFIFINIPPLLSYSEGISLSRLCDGLVLVVRAGETRWEVVQEAKRLLERAGVNILGGVLNRREYFIPSWAYKNI